MTDSVTASNSQRLNVGIFALLAASTVLFAHLSNSPMASGPRRIVALELAFSQERANAFLEAWKRATPEHWSERLLRSIAWDTGLIVSYSALLALLLRSVVRHLGSGFAGGQVWGRALILSPIVAGCLDFAENLGMSAMIRAGDASPPWPQITAIASASKWALLLLCVVCLAVDFATRAAHWRRRRMGARL